MATYGHTFTSGDTVTPTKLNNARTVTDIVNADIKSDAAIAGSKIAPSFNAPAIVAVNSSSDALRITQEGSGNAILVEDSANPDSTPLVVNSLGQIVSGTTSAFEASAGLQITSDSATASNANISIQRCNDTTNAVIAMTRSRGTLAAKTAVQNGDSLGALSFLGYNGTSATSVNGARILARLDAAPGASDMPAALELRTNGVDRMRITSAGLVGIATATPTATLHVSGDAIIAANTSTDALRITQEGSGNALVVEDSANPDSTPLVVNNVGQIISGSTTAWNSAAGLQISADSSSAPNANIALRRCSSDTSAAVISVSKARGTGSSPTLVSDGDVLGIIGFNGHDGSTLRGAASISALVDGTPGASDMPGVLAFSTTADGASTSTERMRITSAGRVGIGTTTPTTALDVNGTVTATAFAGPITGNVTGNVTGNLTGTASAIADGTVSTAKIVDGNVTTAKVADANITTAKIADSSVTNAKIASGVDASKLTTGTLPADRIGSDAITTARIAGGAVTTVKIADGTVSTAKIVDGAVTDTKIASGVDASKLTTGTLPADRIGSSAITTARINDAAVTPAKLSQPYTLATAQNSTSGTSIDFTGIPSWAKRITVMFNGVSTNGSSTVEVRLGTSGGFVSSGYVSTRSGIASNAGFVGSSTTGFYVGGGGASTVATGVIFITNITENSWTSASVLNEGTIVQSNSAGAITLSGTLDRVRITTVNGTDTFDAGSINIAYEG